MRIADNYKYILVSCLLVIFSFSLSAQEDSDPRKDSLKMMGKNIQRFMRSNLDSMKHWIFQMEKITGKDEYTTEHSRTLKSFGEYYNRVGNPDSAFYYFEKSMGILLEIGDSVNYARNSIGLGQTYARLGQNEKAIATFQKGLQSFKDIKDSLGVAIINDNLGTNLTGWGRHNEALKHLLLANEYYRNLGYKIFEGNTFNTIALVYRHTKKREKEMEYYQKAYDILVTQNDSIRLGNVTVNIGNTYVLMDSLKKALPYLVRAEGLFNSSSYQRGLLSVYNAFVQYYQKQSPPNFKQAEEYGVKNVKLADGLKAYRELADATFNLANIYEDQGKYQKAISTYKKCNEIAEEYDFLRKQNASAQHLSLLYERQGKNDLALKYLKEYQQTKDSLLNKEQIEEFKEIELNHEFAQERLTDSLQVIEEKQATALLHQQEMAKEQQSKNALYFGLILIAIIAGFSIWAYQRQQRQSTVLAEKNVEIETALHEKQLLLKEVHHRVKNNFQIISSLLELQSKGIEDEKAKALAQEGKNRVKSMALIHQKLYQNDDLLIYFDEYINKLVKEIADMYGNEKKADVSIQVPQVAFDIDTAIPLGLIVNELVTNAFKYGSSQDESRVSISIQKEQEEGDYRLEIKDNGQGMPDSFDFAKARSMGLRLVRSLSKQLHGSVTYANNEGAVFSVLFKNTSARALVE